MSGDGPGGRPRSTWIVVADDPEIAHLVALGAGAGAPLAAVVAGRRETAEAVAASGVGRVVRVPPAAGTPPEAAAARVAEVVAGGDPGLILAADRPADRALLGAAAARVDAAAFGDALAVEASPAGLLVTRAVCGGLTTQRLETGGPVALWARGGGSVRGDRAVPIEAVSIEAVTIEQAAPGGSGIRLLADEPAEASGVRLSEAERVVAVGRGLRAASDLALVRDLARALDAEVACTRPLDGWLPRGCYVGLSGQRIAPMLYLAAGVSGQFQHLAGVRGAGTIVVVNADASAPFFAECDYGLVGDLYLILPALVRALGRY